MSVSTRDIKRRIRAIGNTKKITKAMELVAGAKMRKAVQAVLATRTYATTAWDIVLELAQKTDPAKHPLLQRPVGAKKIGILLMTSNRGLCGGFNREIVDAVADYMREQTKKDPELKAEVLLLGKRGKDVMFKYGHKIIAEFSKVDTATHVKEVTPLTQMAIQDFSTGKYQKIVLAYTDYHSAMSHTPRVKQLLPLEKQDTELGSVNLKTVADGQTEKMEATYLFEPSIDEVLEHMLYRLVELQVYQALLESNASEHSARMMSMRQASDAAVGMINDLTFAYNQARQEAITTELAEISGGRAALEG